MRIRITDEMRKIFFRRSVEEVIREAAPLIAKQVMEADAGIASGRIYKEKYRTWQFEPYYGDGDNGNCGVGSYVVIHSDRIAAAILSQTIEVEP